MSRRYLTLMVIPHNENRVQEYNLSRLLIWALAGAIAFSLCALVFYATGYYVKLHREHEFAQLTVENATLKEQIGLLTESLGVLRQRVEGLTETDRMMRAWASLSEPGDDVRQMGVGGSIDEVPVWKESLSSEDAQRLTDAYADLDQLVREARFLETSFGQISRVLQENGKVRDQTPSILPLAPDADHWFSSGFGPRTDPFTGRRQFHPGLDIAGHLGTAVLASADGVVETVAADQDLGHHVSIDHGNGIRTLYGHLRSKPDLLPGRRVKRGDIIGRLGDSGRTTAPHLHYAVQMGRKAMDPVHFIFSRNRPDPL